MNLKKIFIKNFSAQLQLHSHRQKRKETRKKLMKLSTNQISVSFIRKKQNSFNKYVKFALLPEFIQILLFLFFPHRKKILKNKLFNFFLCCLLLLLVFKIAQKNTFVILKYEVHQSVSRSFNEIKIKIQTSTRILKWNET